MPGTVYQQQDFATALQNLLPRGKVWPRDPDATMTAFWAAMAGTWKRLSDAALGIANDSPPFQLNQMLPEWEYTLGLPDDCAPANQSVQQRVAAVVAKFSAGGGQSVQYFINLATAMGYTGCTITQNAPARFGRTRFGSPYGGPGWFFLWTLNAPNIPVIHAEFGVSHFGDPYYSLQGNELECTIERYAPAHTVVLFSGHA